MEVTRHIQSSENRKFVIFLQCLKKNNINEVYFLRANNHEKTNKVIPILPTFFSLFWHHIAKSSHFELVEKWWFHGPTSLKEFGTFPLLLDGTHYYILAKQAEQMDLLKYFAKDWIQYWSL